jgi:glucose-6-phosphate isomerase
MFHHDLSRCPNIEAAFRAKAVKCADKLSQQTRPMLDISASTTDMAAWEKASHQLKQYERIVVLGTGGSSLGAKTLCALSTKKSPEIIFFDNIDPTTFDHFFEDHNLSKTAFLVISKSGSTAETLCQALCVLEKLPNAAPGQIVAITEPKESPLQKLAKKRGWPCLDHPTDIGGRFSVLSIVGLLPAMLAGVDIKKVREGAHNHWNSFKKSPSQSPATLAAALHVQLYKTMDISYTVFMPYIDRFENLAKWFRQLWAESLGKEDMGLTPIDAYGTVDQHSQLQLYLDGPKDKFFTVVTTDMEGKGPKINIFDQTPYLENRTMGDLMAAEQKATIDTLTNHGCPTRHIHLNEVNEETLGTLLAQLMLETMLVADMLGVDAFSQPAVEESKRLTRQYLMESKAV